MALQFVLQPGDASAQHRAAMRGVLGGVRRASALASRATAKTIQQKGAADIAASGRFGARWQQGLVVTSEPVTGFQVDNRIVIAHTLPGADNFEFGGMVRGKPLLWIPLSFADPRAKAKGYPGGLFRVERQGKPPLLLSVADKRPKFVGVRSVKIPKKWHLRDIAAQSMANDFPSHYNRFFTVKGEG